jgi:hypothetical protein
MKSNWKATAITSPVLAALLSEKIVLPALRIKGAKDGWSDRQCMTDMKKIIITPLLLTLITFGLWLQACTSTAQLPQATNSPTPSAAGEDPSLTLTVLDQLFADKLFTAALKSKFN